jgi:hypothetical protein
MAAAGQFVRIFSNRLFYQIKNIFNALIRTEKDVLVNNKLFHSDEPLLNLFLCSLSDLPEF